MIKSEQTRRPNARAELAAQIEALVNGTFAQHRQVVLLSYLGQALRKKGFDFREILDDQKLADFIRNELAEKIKIIPTPAGPLILAAVPAEVDLDSEIDPYGRFKHVGVTGGEEGSDREKREPLTRGVWFAFSHALEMGKVRVLRLEPDFEYEDYEVGVEKPEGHEIPAEMIVPVGSVPRQQRNEVIYNNIRAWATQNGIPFRSLFEQRADRKAAKRSALDMLLASLSDSDLSRISMPLDVVAKLRRKQQ